MRRTHRRSPLAPVCLALLLALVAASCGSTVEQDTQSDSSSSTEAGIRLVSAEDGAAIQANPSNDLVILDVRTPEEFAEGHLDGAIMLDFYEDDFADELAKLDPDVAYLLYCRSGNRSGQTAAIMNELGFGDVADIDGGILSWTSSGLPTVAG